MSAINSTGRVLLYLFIAALCTPIIILLWQMIRTGVNLDHGYADVLRSTLGGFVVYGIASEAAAFLLGLPTFYLYRKLHFASWIADPKRRENLHADHGRGVYLIRQLMDEVHFERGANEIRMWKY
jgi:hypothetical protein